MGKIKQYSLEEAFRYDENIVRTVPFYNEMLDCVVLDIPCSQPLCVLDLGIGTGSLTQKLIEKNPNIMIEGWDISNEMLTVARQRFQTYQEKVRLLQGDIFKTDYPDSHYDLVVAVFSLHHGFRDEKTYLLNKIYRALHTNGVFYLVDFFRGESLLEEETFRAYWFEFLEEKNLSKHEVSVFFQELEEVDSPEKVSQVQKFIVDAGFSGHQVLFQFNQFAVIKCHS